MNNTTTKRNLALAAVFMAATLVVGTFAVTTTTQSAYAYQKKKGGGEDNRKGNGNGNTVTIEECKNKGSASGFDTALDQECENLICTHPGENATCVQEGAVTTTTATTPPPVKLTCEQCFTKFFSSPEISKLLRALEVFGVNSLPDLCAQLSSGSSLGLAEFLQDLLVRALGETGAAQLIQCLKDVGVVFG